MRKNEPAANFYFALLELARLRIVLMVLVSCATGYLIACDGPPWTAQFFSALIGTGLLSAGACALNCYIERDLDAAMARTCNRPIPAGVISPFHALLYGVILTIAGSCELLWQVNFLSAFLGITAVLIYLFLYTPAKRLSSTLGS